MATSSPEITNRLKKLYADYRNTADIDARGRFFAADCRQICRPKPTYAAQNRATIVRYLHESSGLSINGASVTEEEASKKKKSFATIRPLRPEEFDFGNDELVQHAGFATVDDLKRHAEQRGWVGMHVDLWEEEEDGEKTADGLSQGTLIKVQYWWARDQSKDAADGDWIQVFHDIMYIGPLDGTQGLDSELIK
ncbi:hypothetical protein SPBR_04476 [Sporothrix brasiliensis 5110]|uniref:SnoaL-like domain-containing protein n=1 Tax=Sporothrix brasiliensis 5110 TaxID=1398154 RepID=A0A0C2FRY8_9PEZI|nr:uncharacterized protein SPBR_04476 [Sporothrix brasiliensis 5110]KIH93778.1 hypothetical protein SPBR_04476 [Sporothrix brasiliensis 5110]